MTVLIGRVWCGWICPFGSLLEWVTFRKARQRAKAISPHWRTVKYVLLVVILVGALFGNLTLLIFEPLALVHARHDHRGHPGAQFHHQHH